MMRIHWRSLRDALVTFFPDVLLVANVVAVRAMYGAPGDRAKVPAQRQRSESVIDASARLWAQDLTDEAIHEWMDAR